VEKIINQLFSGLRAFENWKVFNFFLHYSMTRTSNFCEFS
jgi:hypothetical protein